MTRTYKLTFKRNDCEITITGLSLGEAFRQWVRLMRVRDVSDPQIRRDLEPRRLYTVTKDGGVIRFGELPQV